mmetsp:Transcript_36816/g.72849  ORF Transcript_36816/g.72849 Transcript_36816/m.72849 type:complete len:281 (-) Transcript_36816:168-1010(-)
MGKAKNQESVSFVVDVKEVLGLRPEQRQRWLIKACRKAADGEANIKHVYDVLTSRKLVAGMSDKVGRRMLRILREHLYLFSEKQQRWLNEESHLAMQFSVGECSDGDVEGTGDIIGSSRGAIKPQADDAAARMEEMMARCRDFVRAKASTFEERQREAEEVEHQARVALQRQAAEQRKREWDAIDTWHKQLEGWETACLAANDERRQTLEAAAAAAAEAATAAKRQNRKSRSMRGRSDSRFRRRRRRHCSSSTSSKSSRARHRRVLGERRHRLEDVSTGA